MVERDQTAPRRRPQLLVPWIQIQDYECGVRGRIKGCSSCVGVFDGVVSAGAAPDPFVRPRVAPANEALSGRRRRDSNPRYPVEGYNTLAGCRLQPLGHSSRSQEYIKDVLRLRRRTFYYPSLFLISSSVMSGLSLAGSASRICSPDTSSFILTSVALRVAPKRIVREEI